MANLVVARFADGRLLKGSSLDVDHNRPTCHIRAGDGTMTQVKLADLKALFFVRSLSGDATHTDAHKISPSDPLIRGAHLVHVRFKVGERITGLVLSFPPTQNLFFLTPVDTGGNNLRMLINSTHVATMAVADPPTDQ